MAAPMMARRGGPPVLVLSHSTKRDQGVKAQRDNILAAKTIADIVRTTMGPKSMLKMLLDPMGGIVMTNDGNAILREIDLAHPAAKSIIELSRAQDEEVGDGTTSVVVVAGELLAVSEGFLTRTLLHPTVVVAGFLKALEDALELLELSATELDVNDDAQLRQVVDACLSTKFSSLWGSKISQMALDAARLVQRVHPDGRKEIDVKRYVRVEKIPGGDAEDCCVLDGVLLNKDITHAKMRRLIHNPRVVLLDCPLEYKKGESQTNVEITKEEDWERLLQQEEEEIRLMCQNIINVGCDIVITEKGCSDLAAHFLMKAGISAIRRVKKMDNNRLSRVTGATVLNRTSELTPQDVGTKCKHFEVKKIGDEYYSYFVKCEAPGACTVLFRGGSKDILNEVERNFQDAVNVARNILLEPKLLPGGGAIEMELSARLNEKSKGIGGVTQWPYKALASALEVIPRTLAENCGADVVRAVTELRSRHAVPLEGRQWGIDGVTGKLVDVCAANIWDTFSVKKQILKTAVEAAAMILRIDDVLSGISKKKDAAGPGGGIAEDAETFGDTRDG